jgi:hypothetical protein
MILLVLQPQIPHDFLNLELLGLEMPPDSLDIMGERERLEQILNGINE